MPTIGVCTSSKRSSIKGLLSMLERIPSLQVKFIDLPYNNLKNYKLPAEEIDGLILCHSIHNRRFAISDVTDALYNEFLSHAASTFGKSNIAVIAHDFQWPFKSDDHRSSHSQLKGAKMASFRIQQPTVFKCSSFAMICGRLDKKPEIDAEDLKQLETFTTRVRKMKPVSISATVGDITSWLQDQGATLQMMIVIFLFLLVMYFLYRLVKRTVIQVFIMITVVLVCLFKEQIFSFLWQIFDNVLQKIRSFLARLSQGVKIMVAILATLLLLLAMYSLKSFLIGIVSLVCSVTIPVVLVFLILRQIVPFLRQKFVNMLHKLGSSFANSSTGVKFMVAILSFLLALCLLNILIGRSVSLIYNMTKTVVSVCLILIPIACFLWQKMTSLAKVLESSVDTSAWHAYPFWQVHIRFWQYYTPKGIVYAKGFLKKLINCT